MAGARTRRFDRRPVSALIGAVVVIGASVAVLQSRSGSPPVRRASGAGVPAISSAEPGTPSPPTSPPRALASLIARTIRNTFSPPAAGPTPNPTAAPGACPAPRTCPRFVLTGGVSLRQAPRWPAGSGGIAVIHYRINPRGALTALDDAHVVAAIRAAFASWQAMVPSIRFVYDGTTASPPVANDGQNVVGFGDLTSGNHLGNAIVTASGGTILEADIVLASGRTETRPAGAAVIDWTWRPCGTPRSPCTDLRGCAQIVAVLHCQHDLQNAATHEVGHWLWLGDLRSPQDVGMTMYGTIGAGAGEVFVSERHKDTLGLGDVIGARALYPCVCSAPRIETP